MIIVVRESSRWRHGEEYPVYEFNIDGIEQNKTIEAEDEKEALIKLFQEE